MFEKIFIYSSIDKKENRVKGIFDIIKLVLFIFPAAGLSMGLFSCYIKYISDDLYVNIYYIVALVLMAVIVLFVIIWVKEMFMVYAIGKNGKIYRFKMFAFAMGYLGLGSKIGETAGKGMGRLQSAFEIMMKIKKTIESLDNEEQIEEMLAQGYVSEICDIKIKEKNNNRIKFSASCMGNDTKKPVNISVRKVYNDWENLFKYIEFVSENPNSSIKDFSFIKKTSYEDFAIKKPSYIKRVAKQSFWVITIAAWLGLYTLSSDINKQSKINAGMYTGTQAVVTDVEAGNGKKKDVFIVYNAEGEEYRNVFTTESGKYKEKKKLEIFYQNDNPEKYFMFALEKHIDYKSLLVLVLFCEVIILAVNIDIKPKSW